MIRIGMIIGDRYEIQEKIGTGGMSDVYRALDHKLNRPVAVKVLKQEFSENQNFVKYLAFLRTLLKRLLIVLFFYLILVLMLL